MEADEKKHAIFWDNDLEGCAKKVGTECKRHTGVETERGEDILEENRKA